MRKMKKILAWLTVLTVNVSMMPMPTVAAATATDTDTSATSEESAASEATKEASKAQEAAAKAVKEASKAATTTAAKKTTTATKKTTTKKAKSAQSLEATIEEGIFQDRDQTKIDVESYDASKSEVKKATKDVLKNNNVSKLVDVTYDTNSEGKVESVNVETDATFMAAMDEIDAINEASGSEASDQELQQCYKTYGALQAYYEAKPEYFGIATPYFTSKDTEGTNPIRALLAVMNIEYDEANNKFINTATKEEQEVTVDYVTKIVGGFYYALTEMTDDTGTFTQSGQKGSMYDQYGAKLLEVRDQALKVVKDKKTTAEKLLALNDWLGNYATFDMGYINNEMKNDINGGTTDDSTAKQDEQSEMEGLIGGVLRSSAFGVLVNRKSVCLSYTSAYNYLVQCAFPEIYKNEDGSWKTKDEINGTWEVKKDSNGNVEKVDGKTQYQLAKDSADPTYMVDYVRIQWDSKVKMYGQKQNFNNPHYFSAVKVPNKDGDLKWYYVDSCYNDIYVECLQRNRVETDGNLPHSYFLISDASLRKQFDGNYEYIDTLYKDDSSDTTYEDSWVSKAQGPVYSDGTYYYYVKNTSTYSTSGSNINYQEGNDQLVRRKCEDGLLNGEDEVLVDYKTGKGTIKEGADLITAGYKKDDEVNDKKYPGLTHSAALYNNALYLNLDNKIYKYDLDTDTVTEVKEYNEVSAKQVESLKDFPGMSFVITSNDDKDKVHTVYNHPIAGLAIKDDGKMYVSIATNFTDCAKYKYEETNYNSEYMNYSFGGQTISRGGDNDNQEFMWSANFTETLDMSHLAAPEEEHNYKKVEVAPTCTEDGYTEERCTECGEIKAGSHEKTDKKATGHHYIKAHEFYYTAKDENEEYSETNRNEGDFYLCTDCLDAQSTLPEGEKEGHTYGNATAEWNEDNTKATVTVSCTECTGKELDALLDDQNKETQEKELTKTAETTDIKVEKPEGFDCAEGGEVTYVATANIDGKDYTVEKKVTVEAGQHAYGEPTYTWSDDNETCTATFTCAICGHKEELKDVKATKEVVAPTCTEEGTYTYTATVKFNDKEYKNKKVVTLAAKGHDYDENGVCKVCGHVKTVSKITLKDKTATYTGKTISIDKAVVEGSKGAVTYKYYSDKDCKKEVSAHVNPGVYYVKATVAGDDSYTGTTSAAVKLTIRPQATKVTSVANASSYVTVSWNKVSKASGYYVYRSTDGKKFSKVATVKSAKTVKYSDKKATKNGQKYVYKVVVYYNGNQTVSSAYSATKTGYRLSTMKVSSLSNKKGKKLYVKWAKNSKSSGYQIEYVTGKTKKTAKVSSGKSTNKTISKLKKGKTYTVRIRSYKKVSGTTYYGAWSGKKKIKIKK